MRLEAVVTLLEEEREYVIITDEDSLSATVAGIETGYITLESRSEEIV